MSYLVANPEDRFSGDETHMFIMCGTGIFDQARIKCALVSKDNKIFVSCPKLF